MEILADTIIQIYVISSFLLLKEKKKEGTHRVNSFEIIQIRILRGLETCRPKGSKKVQIFRPESLEKLPTDTKKILNRYTKPYYK